MTNTLRDMLTCLRPYRRAFILAQLLMLLGTAAALAFPWAIRGVFAALFDNTGIAPVVQALTLLLIVSVVREVANYGKGVKLSDIGQRILRDLRARLYNKLLGLSLSYYDQRQSGDIASSLTNDINVVQYGLSVLLTQVLHHAVTLIAVTALLLHLDAVLAAVVFVTLPLIMITAKRMGDRIRVISRQTQDRLAALLSIVQESVSGIAVIQSFVLQDHARDLFRDENERVLRHTLEGVRTRSRAGLVIGLLNALFLLLVIGVGAYRVAAGALQSEDLIAFILYSEMIAGPISMLAGVYVDVSKASAAYDRLQEVLECPTRIARREGTILLENPRGEIVFDGVQFAYEPSNPVLERINLAVQAGESIALVGPSGAGKSTLAKLVPRFYDPTEGRILLDGICLSDLDLDSLRAQIAIVPQDTYLFGLTIAENIACGRPDASREQIEQAAQLANAHDFILNQPAGYDTPVGERGVRLSGGQKQRLALARAFLKDPRILILDEATSSLDTQSERTIQEALDTLMQGRTTLIIAHRLSTIERVDRIIVLREGRIKAVGAHEDLLQSCALYADLYHHQFRSARAPESGISDPT